MNLLGRRFLAVSIVSALLAWGCAFSLYGAYREQSDAGRVRARAELVATALAGALDAAAAGGTQTLPRALAAVAGKGLVRAAAVVELNGTVRAASPGLTFDAEPRNATACAVCHQGRGAVPGARVAGDAGVVYLFRPAAVGGEHLYLALERNALAAAPGELWGAFAAGLLAVVALVGVLNGVFRRQVVGPVREAAAHLLGPEGAAADLEQVALAAGGAALARRELERRLQAGEARWDTVGSALRRPLAEFKQGGQRSREFSQRIFASAAQLSTTVEEFRDHLNRLSNATSDNSTSLIQMSASIDEVAASADELARCVASTAASVEQMVEAIGEVAGRVETLGQETDSTTTAMGHIDASTRAIEVNAREATALSGRMAEAAQDGARAVAETLRGIHASYGVIQDTAHAMDELQESFQTVGGIVKIINEINDKTKLLALNAAIIAAQSGEHGKSFGVVAHEIKSLADRTAGSTGEISRLIKGIRERMAVAAEAVVRGEGATGSSVQLAERAGEALQHIQEIAQVSHQMTREILSATEEQSQGSQKVMASMQEVNAMVTYIRQAAGEHHSSGEVVKEQSGTMRDLTEQVKLATAEQSEVGRYISDAIAAIDRNLQTMVGVVDRNYEETNRIVTDVRALREEGQSETQRVQAMEDALGGAATAPGASGGDGGAA